MKASSTPTTTPSASDPTRRRALALGAGALAALALAPGPARALSEAQARSLIDEVVGQVNAVISSGASEGRMLGRFEAIFVRYADVPVIARSVLGPAARTASPAEIQAFTKAYQGYLARKYGRRFREFIGGRIEVKGARPVKSYTEVLSTAYLQGEEPFDVRWHVSDKSGRPLFFNIIIEGVNLLSSERTEIGSMLDADGGSISALVARLNAT